MGQLFSVNELLSLPPKVVKCSILCFPIFILIFKTKDPHISEVNEVTQTVRIVLLHFYIFEVIVEGKADLANDGRLLILCRIDDAVFVGWGTIEPFLTIFLIDNEIDIWFYFPDCFEVIVYCVYVFA